MKPLCTTGFSRSFTTCASGLWPLKQSEVFHLPRVRKKPQVLRVCLALQWVDNKAVSMLTTSGRANDAVEVKLKTKTGGKWDKKR